MAVAKVLLSSPLVTVSDFSCSAPRSGRDRERCHERASLTLIRRGVHAYHARGRQALAEPGVALLYRSGETYALSHPYERHVPDRSTCIEFDRTLLEEVFSARPQERDLGLPLSAEAQLHDLQLLSLLRRWSGDKLAMQEAAMEFLQRIGAEFAARPERASLPATGRRRAERARALVAAQPEAHHRLEDVAAAAACSPFHLARLFKRHTGMTIRGYRLRLRLALALDEIADGAPDLAAVAVRAGFADHSHMTSAFRQAFGAPPSALRERLGGRRLLQKSKFLQASAGRRA